MPKRSKRFAGVKTYLIIVYKLQHPLRLKTGYVARRFGERGWRPLFPLLRRSAMMTSSSADPLSGCIFLHVFFPPPPHPRVEFSRKVRSLLGSDPQSCPLPLTMLEVFVLLHPSLVLNSMAHFQLVHTAQWPTVLIWPCGVRWTGLVESHVLVVLVCSMSSPNAFIYACLMMYEF